MEMKKSTFNTYNPYELVWGSEVEFPNTRSLAEYGNRVYNRYPARSIFTVPRAILAQHVNKGLNILDPFMGSGTTAVETLLSGNVPYGTEMDPFARLVSESSTTVYNENEFIQINNLNDQITATWSKYKPENIPDLQGIERWFKKGDLEKLLKLKSCIDNTVTSKFLPFFTIVFADCIKPVSKMERQSTKPYISSKYEKITKSVEESYKYSFNAHYKALYEMSQKLGFIQENEIVWLGSDATSFECESNLIDIAITSPPYINAFDYSQCIKVESSLCGIMTNKLITELREVQVGHAKRRFQNVNEVVESIFFPYYQELNKKNPIKASTCQGYFNDIYNNLLCVLRALKNEGEYHIIIGDSNICGVEIPTHEIIAKIAQEIGYNWFGYYFYKIKDHRTSIPRDHESSKIKYEHVIMLKK